MRYKNLKIMRVRSLKLRQINLWAIGDLKKILKMLHLRQRILSSKNNLLPKKEKAHKPRRLAKQNQPLGQIL